MLQFIFIFIFFTCIISLKDFEDCQCLNGIKSCSRHTNVCEGNHCAPGWTGYPMCIQKCGLRSFGKDCSQVCHCLKEDTCDHVTGICPYLKCKSGWTGPSCYNVIFPSEYIILEKRTCDAFFFRWNYSWFEGMLNKPYFVKLFLLEQNTFIYYNNSFISKNAKSLKLTNLLPNRLYSIEIHSLHYSNTYKGININISQGTMSSLNMHQIINNLENTSFKNILHVLSMELRTLSPVINLVWPIFEIAFITSNTILLKFTNKHEQRHNRVKKFIMNKDKRELDIVEPIWCLIIVEDVRSNGTKSTFNGKIIESDPLLKSNQIYLNYHDASLLNQSYYVSGAYNMNTMIVNATYKIGNGENFTIITNSGRLLSIENKPLTPGKIYKIWLAREDSASFESMVVQRSQRHYLSSSLEVITEALIQSNGSTSAASISIWIIVIIIFVIIIALIVIILCFILLCWLIKGHLKKKKVPTATLR